MSIASAEPPSLPCAERENSATCWTIAGTAPRERGQRFRPGSSGRLMRRYETPMRQRDRISWASACWSSVSMSAVRSRKWRRTVATRGTCPAFGSRVRRARLAGSADRGRCGLLRVEVGDDGEHAPVVVWGLREAERAEDVFDVLLDGVLGNDEPFGDRVV